MANRYADPALKKNKSIEINQIQQFEEDYKKQGNRLAYMINRLKEYLNIFNSMIELKEESKVGNEFDMFEKWHSLHYNFEEKWKFAGLTSKDYINPKLLNKMLKTTQGTTDRSKYSEIEFYYGNRSKKFYGDLYQKWNVRIHPIVFEKIRAYNDKTINEMLIDYTVNHIIWGNFEIEDESICMFGSSNFFIPMKQSHVLFACTCLERINEIDQNGENIIGQRYQQYLKILNIFTLEEQKDINIGAHIRAEAYCMIQNHPDKHRLFEEPTVRKLFKVSSYSFLQRSYTKDWCAYGESSVKEMIDGEMKWVISPIEIKINGRLIETAYRLFKYTDKDYWVLENEGNYYTSGIKLTEEAEKIINEEGNKEMIMKFFESLEKYGIRFENSQKRMLISSGNTLALGRSGTGKTTVSAFKILAIELLFKAYSKSKVMGQKNVRLTAKDLSIYSGCSIIFCTASPVLTNEVRRFYKELTKTISEFLLKKQMERLRRKKEAEKKSQEETKQEQEIDKNTEEIIQSQENKEEDDDYIDDEDRLEDQEAREIQESIRIALESTKQEMEDEIEEEEQLNLPSSIYLLARDHFPCFLTIKKLIYMLDASCNYPFFSRGIDGKIYGMDSTTEWHNENKQGAFMINQYHKDSYDFNKKLKKLGRKLVQVDDIDDNEKILMLKEKGYEATTEDIHLPSGNDSCTDSEDDKDYDNLDSYQNYQYLESQKYLTKRDFKIKDQAFAQEVDFEMFESKFWGKNKGRLSVSAMNVWTEIFSVIKGGLQTDWFNYVRRGSSSVMQKKKYFAIKSSMPYITPKEKNQIYWLYVKYEQWKNENNFYDFMDVVKHVSLHYPSYLKSKIDYLIVDEVQDLTPLTIQLLVSVTNKNVFFCGDTAQTIAKGVGFRFYDLKNIFDDCRVGIPSVVQLTKNYRSHSKILDLANSVVDLIECFFPETIDKLQREASTLDGPKPIILEDFKVDDLLAMMIGHTDTKNPVFGCNQVVIVRDQESKSTLPEFLKQALCLTVYEAKGLEFDDVILFNFFNGSPVANQWRILKDLVISKESRRKLRIDEELTINELDSKQFKKKMKKLEEEADDNNQEYEEVNVLEVEGRTEIQSKFSSLCNELKHLYVSITRPKLRLLIYDEDSKSRNSITEYWETCGVIDVVRKGEERSHPVLKGGFEAMADEANSRNEWRNIGIKLFKKKFYLSAVSCFEKSCDDDLKYKCHAYHHADKASNLESEAESLIYAAKNNKSLKKFEKKIKKTEAKKLKIQVKEEFHKSAEMFEKISSFRQSAQCYYTSGNFKKAAELFTVNKQFSQAAECLKMIHQYEKAAKLFEESKLILKSLECYEHLCDWEAILLCLNRNKALFKDIEKETLINKYVPLALNSIFRMIDSSNNEENKGKQLEEKYLNNVVKIEEEVSDVESENEEEEEDLKDEANEEVKVGDKEYNPFADESKIENQDAEKQEEEKIKDHESEEEIITTSKQKNDTSFDIISRGEIEDNFEHLSNFDPEDEFLRNSKSFSVIGSVISNDRESIGNYSEFSILSGSRAGSILNVNTIETDRDIYIEDLAMQKIIYYISLFSDETKSYLQKLRSKSNLLSQQKDGFSADSFELEIDNIDVELVKILLDVLESFDMFRLCMIVCNRYNVKDQLSRYLTSVCFKYSNLKLLTTDNILNINNPVFRRKQQQVSILANEAVHNMFSLVSPDLIKQVKTEDISNSNNQENTQEISSKAECWRFLFYLGFWKKLIYIMDSLSSLKLCYSIGDLKNFKIVYLLNYRSDLTDDQIKQYSENTTGEWIDASDRLNTTNIRSVLCHKVLLEELIASQNTTVNDPNFSCNIALNKWLSQPKQNNKYVNKLWLIESMRISFIMFKKLMGKKGALNQIELFDLCCYFSRVFTNKDIINILGNTIIKGCSSLDASELSQCSSENLNQTDLERTLIELRNNMFQICKLIMSLLEDPLRYHAILGTDDVITISQGLLFSTEIRVPEISDLFLNVLPFALMRRNSIYFKNLSTYLQTYNADRYNRELIENYNRDINFHISNSLLYHSLCKNMANFEKFTAGRCYDFISCNIADIEAEYIRIPKVECFQWFKKSIVSFMFKNVLYFEIENIHVYESKRKKANLITDVTLSQEILHDYRNSIGVRTLQKIIISDQKQIEKQMSNEMIENTRRTHEIVHKIGLPSNYVKNAQLLNTKDSVSLDRKSMNKSKELNEVCIKVMNRFEGMHINLLSFDYLEYNFFLSNSINCFDKCIELIKSQDESFLNTCINGITRLSRVGRMDFATEFINNPTINTFDVKISQSIKNLKWFIQGIEQYQCGLWKDAAESFNTFCFNFTNFFSFDKWIRSFERAWYLLISNAWGQKDGVYLPVNALNYVFEEANHTFSHEIDYFVNMQYFIRKVDVQSVTTKEAEMIFVAMFKTMIKIYELIKESYPFNTHEMINCMFNMVGTLITNAPEFSKTLLTQINKFCSLISESEYIDEENLNKFTEYFGSKKAIDNFKLDFYEISDEEKNDTLYYNIHDKVVNQYFIHLTIVPVSNSKITSIAKIFQNYCDMKMIKIVTHSRLRKRLKKQMKNVALSRKNDNLLKQKEALSIGNIMWIIQSQSTDLTNCLKAVCQNSQFQGVLKRVESTINKLYNIFCSSYTIKNSFDTHFVVDNIDKMNSLSIKARNDLSVKLTDIYQSYKSTDESFNPFIEIEQTEEKGFAMTEAQDRANQVISQITKELNDSLSTVIEDLDSWLSQKASPEMLNLEAKQLVLKQKLKWEKMYTSRERLNYLKKIMNKYKKRR